MFRSIVVGCDGSDASFRAIELAEQLRDRHDGQLTLVSVFSFYRGLSAPALPLLYSEWLHDQAHEILSRAADRVSDGVPFEKQSMSAPSAGAGLNDVAESISADLIVLGPSHRHQFGRLTGRTTVQRLLHGAPCAVAVAAPDQGARFDGAPRIAVAYDGSAEALHARDVAYGIAQTTRATVRLCGAIEPLIYPAAYAPMVPDPELIESQERAAKTSLADAAAAAPDDIAIETAFGVGYPPTTILDLAGDDVSLLVAGSRGYGTLHRALAGATSGTLLTNGRVPVLVTPRVTCTNDDAARSAEAVAAG